MFIKVNVCEKPEERHSAASCSSTAVSVEFERNMTVLELLSKLRSDSRISDMSKNLFLSDTSLPIKTIEKVRTGGSRRYFILENEDTILLDGGSLYVAKTPPQLYEDVRTLLSTPLTIFHQYHGLEIVQKPEILAIKTRDKKEHCTFIIPQKLQTYQAYKGHRQDQEKGGCFEVIHQLKSAQVNDFLFGIISEFGLDATCTVQVTSANGGCIKLQTSKDYGSVSLHDLNLAGPLLEATVWDNNEGFEIIAKSLTGKTYTISGLSPYHKISYIKSTIFEMDGIPQKEQRLFFAGTQLEDDRTLDDYNILEGSTVHLVLRLRGGMFHVTSARIDNERLFKIFGGPESSILVNVLLPDGTYKSISIGVGLKMADLASRVGTMYVKHPRIASDSTEEEDDSIAVNDAGDAVAEQEGGSKRLRVELLDDEHEKNPMQKVKRRN